MSLVLKTAPQVTVATSGSEQRLVSGSISNVEAVYVSAPAANTGDIFVGDSDVAVGRGITIPKGTTAVILSPKGEMLDIYNMYVDAATNNDKANVSYLKRAVG